MHRTATLRSKQIKNINYIQNENILSHRFSKIKTIDTNIENELSSQLIDCIESSIEDLDFFQTGAADNLKNIDFENKLNDIESKCYPGQRRPKLRINKGNLNININDMYSDNDFISKPSTTEQNISFNNKKEYLTKVLSKEINEFNNKTKNLLTETRIKLKKSKQNKNSHRQNNRNSVNYAKFINSIVNKKETLIDKAQKSKRHFSANQETKIKYKNTLNKNSFSKKNNKLIPLTPYFIEYSKTATKIKINSQKMTQKIKAFKSKNSHSPSTQKSMATKNTTNSTKKHLISTNSKIGKMPPYHIFDNQNIMFNKTKYNNIPQEYICISKITDNSNNYNSNRKYKNNNTDIFGLKSNTIISDKNKKLNHEYKKFKNKINDIKIYFFLDNKTHIDKLNKKEKSKKQEKVKSLNYVTKI